MYLAHVDVSYTYITGVVDKSQVLYSAVLRADKMLCGVTLSRAKRRKSRNKSSGLCRVAATQPRVCAGRHRAAPYSVDVCTGSDVTETENCATVADDAPCSCEVKAMTSLSFDVQRQSTEGET